MSCRDMNSLISPYLDGWLNSSQIRRLEAHVATCNDCRYKLELMQEIPQALQTHRMLAPHPEFTAVVMQKIVITSQLQTKNGLAATLTTEFRSETRTFRTANPAPAEKKPSEKAPEQEAKILNLFRPETKPTKAAGAYVLRFSSMAAALVVAVGIGIYALQPGLNTPASVSTSEAIGFFAHTLTDAFQSPVEIVLGAIITAGLVVALWLAFRTSSKNQFFQKNELSQERDLNNSLK